MTRTWSESKERSNTFTLKLICWLALHTSRGFARILLYPITLYFLMTSPRVRKASVNYLRRVYSKSPGLNDVAKHIFWFAATILDRVYFITDQPDQFEIEIFGNDILDGYTKDRRSCMLLGAHLGSFEALRSLGINRSNLKLKVMMYHEHNAMMMRVLDSLNPKLAASIINLADDNALLKMKEAVDQGEHIGMLADRCSEEKFCNCELLGDPVRMPTGPLSIACIIHAPVLLFFPLYLGKNKYALYIEELSGPLDLARNKRDRVIADLMQKYTDRLEHYIRISPLNWFNFYDYWADEEN